MSEKRLRILFVANPSSVHTQRWVSWFAKRHDVLLYGYPAVDPKTWTHPDIKLAPTMPSGTVPVWTTIKIVRHLRGVIRDFKPDIIHSHYLVPRTWLVAATGFHPTVATAWGSDILQTTRFQRYMNRWALKRTDLATSDSADAVRILNTIRGQGLKTELIQFGVDTERFRIAQPVNDLRSAWNIPAHAKLVVSPRILRPLYNGQTIARSFISIANEHPDVFLVFLAYNADASYLESVKQILDKAHLMDRVRFIPSIPHDQMPDLYQSANIVVSVPDSDTTPVTLLEAMACGAMCISTDLPSIREWVSNPNFLVPPKHHEQLVAALQRALSLGTELRARYVAENRQIVEARASQDHEMKQMETLYLQLLKS